MKKQRTFVHFLKNGRITRAKPAGCYNPSKGTKIKVKGQADARIKICYPKPKKSRGTSKKRAKGGRKSVKVKAYKYQKKVDTKRARKIPGTSKKTVKVSGYKRKK